MVNEDHPRCTQCGLVGHDISACTANADDNSGSDRTDEPQKFVKLFGVNINPNCLMTEDGKKNSASTSTANDDSNTYISDDPMMDKEDGKTETKKDASIFTAIDDNDDSNEKDLPKTGIIITEAGETATQEALHRKNTKGLKWSNEEHQRFLLGDKEVGRSNHKEIAEKYVKTRTRTQVASYSQNYHRKRKRTSLKDASFKRPDDNAEQDCDSQQQASTSEPKMKRRSLRMSASNAPPEIRPDNVEQESSVRASVLPCSSDSDSLPQVGKQKSPLQYRHPPSCSSDSNSRLQQAELDVDTNKEHQINNPEEDGTSDTEDDHRSQ